MATNASISKLLPNGEYRTIYLHFDGYPEHALGILANHFNTSELVDQLLDLGNLSEIHPHIAPAEGQEHSWHKPIRGVCVAYGRDRNEAGQEATVQRSRPDDYCFNYLFAHDQWVYTRGRHYE